MLKELRLAIYEQLGMYRITFESVNNLKIYTYNYIRKHKKGNISAKRNKLETD